jgi:hypothetical protein
VQLQQDWNTDYTDLPDLTDCSVKRERSSLHEPNDSLERPRDASLIEAGWCAVPKEIRPGSLRTERCTRGGAIREIRKIREIRIPSRSV